MDLKAKSIEIILENQHECGSYIACPTFVPYKYCWLRDGSFIAYSMDMAGQAESAGRFFDWVDKVVSGKSGQVAKVIRRYEGKEEIKPADMLPTRYNMDGSDTADEWPNFQLDGYGAWLWSLCRHMEITGQYYLIEKYAVSIKTSLNYLLNFWKMPCYDCWEENGDKVHTSTLACLYGGLNAISKYVPDMWIRGTVREMQQFVLKKCVVRGRLDKYEGSDSVDASLLWVSLPFGLLDIHDPVMVNTVAEIENKLLHQGGVHRYPEDTYYGGGEWLLLSSWLGWYYCRAGNADKAKVLLRWVENHAGVNGEMPEQVLAHVNQKGYIEKWVADWGEVASPLLWSHAMYLVLKIELEKGFLI